MFRLENKIIIVTGGSGLLGMAILDYIAKEKGIAINADINVETCLEEGKIFCDITDDASIQQVIEAVIEKFQRIDGLVNNAYPRTTDWDASFEEVSPNSWRKNVDIQMNSCFVFSQMVLKQMRKQKNGSIVNVSSIYGVVGNDFSVYEGTNMTSPAAYSAIKGGIINFTRYLASYFGKYGIRVNSVSPGGIFNNQNPIFVKNYENKVPLKRMAKPEDIAPSIGFLLSDESSYITGHNLIVDGGWTCI
jgi:NAD(P)-dependent dehydrogenase (short-subunit alcohol dehydrogenase family)